jgi:hypothetical protein
MSFHEDFKYDWPRTYRIIAGVTLAAFGLALFAALPDNDAMRATGVVALQERSKALGEAAYWQARAAINRHGESAPVVEYGSVIGINAEKRVVVSIPRNDRFVTQSFQLANVVVTDLEATAAIISRNRLSNARVDVYGDAAVIWIDDTPLNVDLVKLGLARPAQDPPTNIVDRAFAAYFWNVAAGS